MVKTPIVLIHGLWMTPHSWRGWIDRYHTAGHIVHAPSWPGVSALDEALDHTKAPADIGLLDVADHYDRCFRSRPPTSRRSGGRPRPSISPTPRGRRCS
jgi:pimeloyl-ACP methyl ester carboxylesterase